MQCKKEVDNTLGILNLTFEISLKENANADKDGNLTLPAPPADDPLWQIVKTGSDVSKVSLVLRQADGAFLNLLTAESRAENVVQFSGASTKHKEQARYTTIFLMNGDKVLHQHNLGEPAVVEIGQAVAVGYSVRELVIGSSPQGGAVGASVTVTTRPIETE